MLRFSAKYATKKERRDRQRVEKFDKPILCGSDHTLPRGRRCRRPADRLNISLPRLEPRLPAFAAGRHAPSPRCSRASRAPMRWSGPIPTGHGRYTTPTTQAGSTLTTMQAGMGYWIKMTSAKTLSVSGSAPSSSIPLGSGWNLVGYDGLLVPRPRLPSPACNRKPPGRPGAIPPKAGSPTTRRTAPGTSTFKLCPGAGYWINVNSADTWTPPSSMCSPSPSTARNVHRPPCPSGQTSPA